MMRYIKQKGPQVWKYVDDLAIGENWLRGTSCNLQPSLDIMVPREQTETESNQNLRYLKAALLRAYASFT